MLLDVTPEFCGRDAGGVPGRSRCTDNVSEELWEIKKSERTNMA